MATLCSLPVEMFHHIVDEVPLKHDLKELRLTCREVEHKTRVRYGKVFFSAFNIAVGPECSRQRMESPTTMHFAPVLKPCT